jgi:hypothetical protein
MSEQARCRVTHVGVLVHSIEDALPRWTNLYGMTLIRRFTVPQEGVFSAFLSPDGGRDGFLIELVEPMDKDDMGNLLARRLRERGEGLLHLAMTEADVAAARRRLRAGEAVFAEREPVTDGGDVRLIISPHAGNGVMVEILSSRDWKDMWDEQDVAPVEGTTSGATVAADAR